METIKNAANYVSETVQGAGSEASKEANKVSNNKTSTMRTNTEY